MFKNKKIKLFILCLLIGFVIATLYFCSLNKNDLDLMLLRIKESDTFFNPINTSTDNIKILSLIILFSFIYVGFILFLGLLITEGFKIFLKSLFIYKIYKFKGVMYLLLYTIINNLMYFIILYFIFRRIINVFSILYKYRFKNENINYNLLYNNLIKLIFLVIINFIIDYVLYLNGISIINFLRYLFAF